MELDFGNNPENLSEQLIGFEMQQQNERSSHILEAFQATALTGSSDRFHEGERKGYLKDECQVSDCLKFSWHHRALIEKQEAEPEKQQRVKVLVLYMADLGADPGLISGTI